MLPKVNFVDETEIRPPYVHRKRRAGEQILYFIRHGEMHLLEDGKPLILKPGDVCLLDKDRTHEGTKAVSYTHLRLYANEAANGDALLHGISVGDYKAARW